MGPEPAGSITDVSIAWPTLDAVVRTLTLRAGYNSTVVVIAAALLGLAAGVVGTFALLRRRALMGDVLAHCTLPGIGAAFLAATWLGGQGRSLPVLLVGAAASGVLGVLCVQAAVRHTRLREDAAMGAVLSVFFGVGVVLLSYIQGLRTGNQGGLTHFIYGQTAAMRAGDAWLMGIAAVIAVAAAVLLFKELRLVCFDDRFAAAMGLPVGALDLLMMSLVVLVTVIGLQAVGLLLVVALLIIPPATARLWTERLVVMLAISGAVGGLSGYLGASASALLPRLPAGAVIVLTGGVLFGVSLLAAPRRGVIAGALRLAALRARVAEDHALRAAYEALEISGREPRAGEEVPVATIAEAGGWSPVRLRIVLWWLRVRGLVRRDEGRLVLTAAGLKEAMRVTRNHRMWEEFLVAHADLAPTHVDRSADLVEHVLSKEIVAELEAALERRGRLPGGERPPASVHDLKETAA